MSVITDRLHDVENRIHEAQKRSPYGQDVTLVAVTKFHPLADMMEVIDDGITQVGENRVQEMEEKFRELDRPVTWNLQGHLQKNKVKKAVLMADLIQSGDSLDILKEIDKRAGQINKVQPILLEFNISGEETKTGIAPEDFDKAVELAKSLPHICVNGLMCMAPEFDDLEKTRPVFRKGREMYERLQKCFPEGQISILSMGMTHDFEIAIEEGSNMVRIGTAIFGKRDYR
jgi:pyridoxal phosphate enzyme (YggS family)